MQNFLNWLDDHGLLDPLEKALGIVGIVLYVVWWIVLVLAAIGIVLFALALSGWWLLVFIPWLLLVVATLTLYYYINDKGGLF